MQKSENGRWKTKWLYICIEIEGRECQRSFLKLEQIQSEENPKKIYLNFPTPFYAEFPRSPETNYWELQFSSGITHSQPYFYIYATLPSYHFFYKF